MKSAVIAVIFVLSILSQEVKAGDKGGTIILGGGGGMGGLMMAGDSIIAPGMGWGMMPLIISGGGKGKGSRIIMGRRRRRDVAFYVKK
jgi:hypothetical protein